MTESKFIVSRKTDLMMCSEHCAHCNENQSAVRSARKISVALRSASEDLKHILISCHRLWPQQFHFVQLVVVLLMNKPTALPYIHLSNISLKVKKKAEIKYLNILPIPYSSAVI